MGREIKLIYGDEGGWIDIGQIDCIRICRGVYKTEKVEKEFEWKVQIFLKNGRLFDYIYCDTLEEARTEIKRLMNSKSL